MTRLTGLQWKYNQALQNGGENVSELITDQLNTFT
jgi:hypothetical protein